MWKATKTHGMLLIGKFLRLTLRESYLCFRTERSKCASHGEIHNGSRSLRPTSQQSLNEMANEVQGIAHAYKESGEKAKAAFGIVALFLGLIFLGSLLGGD